MNIRRTYLIGAYTLMSFREAQEMVFPTRSTVAERLERFEEDEDAGGTDRLRYNQDLTALFE